MLILFLLFIIISIHDLFVILLHVAVKQFIVGYCRIFCTHNFVLTRNALKNKFSINSDMAETQSQRGCKQSYRPLYMREKNICHFTTAGGPLGNIYIHTKCLSKPFNGFFVALVSLLNLLNNTRLSMVLVWSS